MHGIILFTSYQGHTILRLLEIFFLFFNIDNDVAVVVTVADFIVDAYALFVALELASL